MTEDGGFTKKSFAPGEVILEEDMPGEGIYLITSGKVEIRKNTKNKGVKKLAILEKGDIMGEMSMLDGQPHMATAVAIKETHLTIMSKEVFQAKVEAMDPILKSAIQTLVKRARQMAENFEMEEDFMDRYNAI
ncbi:MAG: cyclic nucleotide-binding domain-containing protein [Rhodospirillales bacterium]|nr:cyclic nucleotide-binding domain-containing protein [Rhodospirillales bacterium]